MKEKTVRILEHIVIFGALIAIIAGVLIDIMYTRIIVFGLLASFIVTIGTTSMADTVMQRLLNSDKSKFFIKYVYLSVMTVVITLTGCICMFISTATLYVD